MKPDLTYYLNVFKTTGALNMAAATLIIDTANKAVAEKGRFTIALSGGQTPMELYLLLAETPFCDELPWKNTSVFWGDERCVPEKDMMNNAHAATTVLLDKVGIPTENIHRIPVNLPSAKAAAEYEKTIKDYFKDEEPCFDIILLGLGENGHTASLFPGTKVTEEKEEGVRDVYVKDENMFRVTMTAPLINKAHTVLFLVSGKKKAKIMRTVLSVSAPADKYPAKLIKPTNGKLLWYADEQAASLIQQTIKV